MRDAGRGTRDAHGMIATPVGRFTIGMPGGVARDAPPTSRPGGPRRAARPSVRVPRPASRIPLPYWYCTYTGVGKSLNTAASGVGGLSFLRLVNCFQPTNCTGSFLT